MFARGAAWMLAAALLSLAPNAHAQDEHRLRWDEDWSRVHPASYVITGAAIAGTLFLDYLFDPGPEALVRGPAIFDDPWRARLMAPTEEDRERAASASDVLLGVLLLWPFVDSIGVVGLGDLNSDVFWQLSMIAAESLAADLLLSTIAKQFVARERPLGDRCSESDRRDNPRRCGARGRLRSFYSGHSSAAFNSAGLVCISHAHLRIYGSEALDAFACGAALLTATIVATLRVVADRHHATDVVVGGLVGLATGLLLPWALHFAWDPDPETSARMDGLSSTPPPYLSYAGTF
jgi:membrane-associated phospholipid phosphatase